MHAARDVGLAVDAIDLVKTYKDGAEAVRGVSLGVPAGSIFGLLGAAGAGKSTVLDLLTTLAEPTSGTALVAGYDIVTEMAAVRSAIGCVTQDFHFDVHETARENLLLQGQLYGIRDRELQLQTAELLHRFALSDAADRLVKTYSAAMKRRLGIAMALIHEPELLILDEPTAGLAPLARAELWDQLRELVWDHGLTLLFATRCAEEAGELAHRLAILECGQIKTEGAPGELRAELRDHAAAELETRAALGSSRQLLRCV